MPSKNSVKSYGADTHYHIYNRGVAGMPIFEQPDDYAVFLNLLKRHLGAKPVKDFSGRELLWLADGLDLEAYCLMRTHFHLLVYQKDDNSMPTLMKALTGAYTRYFNKKYRRFGPLLQGVYKAAPIVNDSYLTHISRYIHMNPKNYLDYPYSSINIYLQKASAEWVKPEKIVGEFKTPDDYQSFLKDYVNEKEFHDKLKAHLADS